LGDPAKAAGRPKSETFLLENETVIEPDWWRNEFGLNALHMRSGYSRRATTENPLHLETVALSSSPSHAPVLGKKNHEWPRLSFLENI
jgi:hypothetical protein